MKLTFRFVPGEAFSVEMIHLNEINEEIVTQWVIGEIPENAFFLEIDLSNDEFINSFLVSSD